MQQREGVVGQLSTGSSTAPEELLLAWNHHHPPTSLPELVWMNNPGSRHLPARSSTVTLVLLKMSQDDRCLPADSVAKNGATSPILRRVYTKRPECALLRCNLSMVKYADSVIVPYLIGNVLVKTSCCNKSNFSKVSKSKRNTNSTVQLP